MTAPEESVTSPRKEEAEFWAANVAAKQNKQTNATNWPCQRILNNSSPHIGAVK
jgi:hypothetical protein